MSGKIATHQYGLHKTPWIPTRFKGQVVCVVEYIASYTSLYHLYLTCTDIFVNIDLVICYPHFDLRCLWDFRIV